MVKNTKKPKQEVGPEEPAKLYASAYAARLAKEVVRKPRVLVAHRLFERASPLAGSDQRRNCGSTTQPHGRASFGNIVSSCARILRALPVPNS